MPLGGVEVGDGEDEDVDLVLLGNVRGLGEPAEDREPVKAAADLVGAVPGSIRQAASTVAARRSTSSIR